MSKNKIFVFVNLLIFSIFIMSCSSQEYTTAKLAIQQKDFPKVAEWLPKALEVEPDNPEILVVMGVELHARNQEWADMVLMFKKAMDIDSLKTIEMPGRNTYLPVNVWVKSFLDDYYVKEFNEGLNIYNSHKDTSQTVRDSLIEIAIKKLDNASIIRPSDPKTKAYRSLFYSELKDTLNARKLGFEALSMKKIVEGENSNKMVFRILHSLKTPDQELIPYYQDLISIDPNNSDFLRGLAECYYAIGKREESLKVFKDAINNEEDNILKANLWYNLGIIYEQMCEYEDSEESFDQAFFLNGEDYEACLGMARAYEGQGNRYYAGGEDSCGNEVDKDLSVAYRYYRKAESKIKEAMYIDIENKENYKKLLKNIRYKKDAADES